MKKSWEELIAENDTYKKYIQYNSIINNDSTNDDEDIEEPIPSFIRAI